jgi:hypothetical protein
LDSFVSIELLTPIQFSKDSDFIYLTAGDHATVKVWALPVPPTPSKSTTNPSLDAKYTTPFTLTHGRAASGLQTLSGGKVVFSLSSFTSPNDVFLIRNLDVVEEAILSGNAGSIKDVKINQITHFSAEDLKDKDLAEGETFYFKGALDKDVQGWALKPKGWQKDDKKKWPVVLLIHGGTLHDVVILRALVEYFTRTSRGLGRPVVDTVES